MAESSAGISAGPFVSYAQNREDVMLWRALRDQQPGFYIDVGAADPDLLSVTRAFYDRGWRGLNIEPLPERAARLREARPGDLVIEAAVSDQPGSAAFHRVTKDADTGLSTLDGAAAAQSGGIVETIEVEVTTLAAICRAHAIGEEVHFLKIDVEGAEADVLRGADFRATRPWIILIEATTPDTGEPNSAEWEKLLTGAGYVHVWFDGLNRFYLAQEHSAALAKHFQVPPNPFDRYVIADIVTERQFAAIQAYANACTVQIQQLEAELAALRTPPRPRPPHNPFARLAYGLLRPLLRPIFWRLRAFLLAPLQDDLAVLREQQRKTHERLEVASQPRPDPKLEHALEAAVLTLSLERERCRKSTVD